MRSRGQIYVHATVDGGGFELMRLRRRAGSPIAPHMDEVYVDLHLLTELVLLLARDLPEREEAWDASMTRLRQLRAHLDDRLEAQKKEIEDGPPPPP